MVPASLPAPALLVTATGVLELIGAIGLLVPPRHAARVARAAAAVLDCGAMVGSVVSAHSLIGMGTRR